MFTKVWIIMGCVIGMFVFAAGFGLLMAFPIKWTWNAVMPYLFNLPLLTWGKAWCVMFLSGSLLKSSQHNIK